MRNRPPNAGLLMPLSDAEIHSAVCAGCTPRALEGLDEDGRAVLAAQCQLSPALVERLAHRWGIGEIDGTSPA